MKQLLFAVLLTTVAGFASAQTITFTFGSNGGGGESQAALDGLASGTVTVNGLTLTAAANTGTFNSTASEGFGINASAAGDQTALFDTYTGGADSMSISFNSAVNFNSIDLNSFGAGDAAFFTYSGGTVNITTDPFTFSNVSLAAGETATFGAASGAFGLQSFNVTVVPEPSTYAMMGLGAALLVGVQRFRRRNS